MSEKDYLSTTSFPEQAVMVMAQVWGNEKHAAQTQVSIMLHP